MSILISVVGPSGIGKTSLCNALGKAGGFYRGEEQHNERPFQSLFAVDRKYAFANQIDYLLFRAEQERELRLTESICLMDGGLDLDMHGFTRLFHTRGFINYNEYGLCQRLYSFIRSLQPLPDLFIHMKAIPEVVRGRLESRQRINIASAEDIILLNEYIDEWLSTVTSERILSLDVTAADIEYTSLVPAILERINSLNSNSSI